jgi:uncharacterized membrane protein YfcA
MPKSFRRSSRPPASASKPTFATRRSTTRCANTRLQKVPHLLVVGKREAEEGTVAVRTLGAEHHVPGTAETGATGLVSGVLTGFAGMPGPPVVPYYLRRAITPTLARASMMTIFMATSIAGVLSALALGVATWREPAFAAVLFPAVLLGNWLGHLAFGKVSDTAWRTFTGGVLGLAAVAALWKLLQA